MCLWEGPRAFKVSFSIDTGENKAKGKEKKEAVKIGSREAEKQRIERAGSRAAKTHD